MNWRVMVLGLTGVLTMITAVGRFEDGKSGFLLWAPIATTLMAFAGAILVRRTGTGGVDRRDHE